MVENIPLLRQIRARTNRAILKSSFRHLAARISCAAKRVLVYGLQRQIWQGIDRLRFCIRGLRIKQAKGMTSDFLFRLQPRRSLLAVHYGAGGERGRLLKSSPRIVDNLQHLKTVIRRIRLKTSEPTFFGAVLVRQKTFVTRGTRVFVGTFEERMSITIFPP